MLLRPESTQETSEEMEMDIDTIEEAAVVEEEDIIAELL